MFYHILLEFLEAFIIKNSPFYLLIITILINNFNVRSIFTNLTIYKVLENTRIIF